MEMAKSRYQNDRNDPIGVALWYAIFIVGFPIRLALNYLVPSPDTAALQFLRWTHSAAAIVTVVCLVGQFLMILLALGFSLTETIWPSLSEKAGHAFGKTFIGLLATMFGGWIISTGLHGYLKNFPSAHADD